MSLSRLFSTNSLTGRLTLYYALAFYLFLGTTFIVLYLAIGATLNNRMDEDLAQDMEEFAGYLALSGLQQLKSEMDKEASNGEEESVILQLFNRSGEVIHTTNTESWHGFTANRRSVMQQLDNPAEVELITLKLPAQDSETRLAYGALSPDYVLAIGESNHERDDIMELLAIAFALVFFLAIPLATVLVLFLTRRAVSGIKLVSEAVCELKSGNLDRRVNIKGQVAEVQALADTFDAMASRIQNLIHDMRDMTDNIAHDLRSPLGRVRLLAESIVNSPSTDQFGRQAAVDTISQCDRLIRMINLSLDLAETEAGVGGRKKENVNLTAMVEDACELFEAVTEQKGLSLATNLEDHLWTIGDSNGLQRMVANLLDNAIKFTPAGGEIKVALSARQNQLQLIIRDSGIGIDDSNFEAIFNRFFRVDPSRTSGGCGLGLSYSRAVARACGGDITVQSRINEFTQFCVTLPAYVDEQNSMITSSSNRQHAEASDSQIIPLE